MDEVEHAQKTAAAVYWHHSQNRRLWAQRAHAVLAETHADEADAELTSFPLEDELRILRMSVCTAFTSEPQVWPVGLRQRAQIRCISLWPFPKIELYKLAQMRRRARLHGTDTAEGPD